LKGRSIGSVGNYLLIQKHEGSNKIEQIFNVHDCYLGVLHH